FTLDGTSQGSVVLDGSGHASFTPASLSTGPHTLSAKYSGDANFNTVTSSTVGQTVAQAQTSVAAVTASPTSSVFGQAVMFSTTVSAVLPGMGTPTGTVTFLDNGVVLGSGTLSAG